MKPLLLALTLLCCAAWLAAQTSTPSGSPQDPSSAPSSQNGSQTGNGSTQTSGANGNESTIQGCLTSSGGNFILTDAAGMQYQLQGNASRLQPHVNTEVQVRGMASAASSDSGASSDQGMGAQGTGAAAAAGSTQMFTVSKVKKISGSCTAAK